MAALVPYRLAGLVCLVVRLLACRPSYEQREQLDGSVVVEQLEELAEPEPVEPEPDEQPEGVDEQLVLDERPEEEVVVEQLVVVVVVVLLQRVYDDGDDVRSRPPSRPQRVSRSRVPIRAH